MSPSRPAGVVLVAVLSWISGALDIVGGILLLAVSDAQTADHRVVAWVSIALGIVTILVSVGLFGGNTAARALVTIVFAVNIAAAIVLIVTHQRTLASAIASGVVALIGLLLLYTRRANEFFRS